MEHIYTELLPKGVGVSFQEADKNTIIYTVRCDIPEMNENEIKIKTLGGGRLVNAVGDFVIEDCKGEQSWRYTMQKKENAEEIMRSTYFTISQFESDVTIRLYYKFQKGQHLGRLKEIIIMFKMANEYGIGLD